MWRETGLQLWKLKHFYILPAYIYLGFKLKYLFTSKHFNNVPMYIMYLISPDIKKQNRAKSLGKYNAFNTPL